MGGIIRRISSPKIISDFAIIFDMDGVIVNSTPYHEKAWKLFLKRYGYNLSESEFKHHVNGKINFDIIKHFFPKASKKEIESYGDKKEKMYREIINKEMISPEGLLKFIFMLAKRGIAMAIGTSAPPQNVNFVLKKLHLRKYFPIIIDASQIKKGKPNPEIYLKVAKKRGYPPSKCIVIEDAILGIQAAKNAKMRVIAITTTQRREELKEADMVIDSFSELSYEKLIKVMKKKENKNP